MTNQETERRILELGKLYREAKANNDLSMMDFYSRQMEKIIEEVCK